MKYRLIHLANGKCRIQRRHWFLTLGFWVYMRNSRGEYFESSESHAKSELKDFINRNTKVRYEEL